VICRLWRGWTTKNDAGAYERIVRGEVIPGIQAHRIPGFRSIDLVRREREHDVEFMTLMWFDGLDSLKRFEGEDYQAAHVPARAQAVLAGFDRRPADYEVLERREQPQQPFPCAGQP
jgi:heme-degrading monooxygenase HmoA